MLRLHPSLRDARPATGLFGMAYLLIAAVTSAPFFFKHFPNHAGPAVVAYIIGLVGLVWASLRANKPQAGIPDRFPIWFLGILPLVGLNLFAYPSTRLVAHLSSAPDALIEPSVRFWLHGQEPYSAVLPDGAPISPGPGWILMNAPFLLTGGIGLLLPFYFAWAAERVARYGGSRSALAFVGALLACLNLVQMSVTGHDLPAAAMAFVALTLIAYGCRTRRQLVGVALLTGVVATARVPFIVVPVAIAVCLTSVSCQRALQFAAIAIGMALALHITFFAWAHAAGGVYDPLHVFGRAGHTSWVLLGAGALVWCAGGWCAYRRLTAHPARWLFLVWVTVMPPFAAVGVGELVRAGITSAEAWANWEGKGYVFFTLPLLVAALVLEQSGAYALREEHRRQ